MIRTVAELLDAFRVKEVEILDKQNIKHPPTIGSMYEGLTHELLRMSLPENLELHVVSGFIESEEGELSPQIDCMLVSGEGFKIPYTEIFKYPVSQVVAVIEVKKNLFSNSLASAYHNLLDVIRISFKDQQSKDTAKQQFQNAYYSLVGEDPFSYTDFDALPLWKQFIVIALNEESLTPVRIVLGYHGFSSENNLREAFFSFLEKNIRQFGYGPSSFPNLIICGNYSLVKLNCMPYGFRMNTRESFYELFGLFGIDNSDVPYNGENMWPLYASYPENPLLLLLELIWTRLAFDNRSTIAGSDLGLELIRPLILAKAVQQEDEMGWYYEYFPFSDEQLANLPTLLNWQPIEINEEQCMVILNLLDNENAGLGGLNIQSSELLNSFNKDDRDDIIQSITMMGIAILDENKLKLVTRQLAVAVLPNGKIVAGDDNEGMFTRWMDQNF